MGAAHLGVPAYYTLEEVGCFMTANDIQHMVGNAEEFPVLRDWHFFNHAAVSPIPHSAAQAIRRYAAQAETQAYIDSGWYRDVEKLRELAGGLINAQKEEIAFVKNTSEGLATVANGLRWRRGDRVVTTSVEYPANIYPWMDLAERYGVELVKVSEQTSVDGRRRVPLERILEEAAHPNTRLVSLSHVEFASGQRHDLATIGASCRENGKLFCVDAIQSVGMVKVDVQAMKIDFLSADGHKWMLGPEGAGIFYCRRDLLGQVRPLVVGWLNVINAMQFGSYDFTLRSDSGRFESGSHNIPGLLALKASVELLGSAGIEAIEARIRLLTDRVVEAVSEKGYEVISPRGEGEWSGIVSFVSPRHDHEEIVRRLHQEHRIEIIQREGRLRCSPHFYNTEEQLEGLVNALPG